MASTSSLTYTGDGTTTKFRLPYPCGSGTVAVTVGGVSKSAPGDYTIIEDTDGFKKVLFGSAPAGAAAVVITITHAAAAYATSAVDGDFSATGDLTAGDDVIVGDDLTVAGKATIGETLKVTGATTVAAIQATGAASFGSSLGLTGVMTCASSANFGGVINKFTALPTSNPGVAGQLYLSGDAVKCCTVA